MLQPDGQDDGHALCLSGDTLFMFTGLLSVLLFAFLPIGVTPFRNLKM